uniref:Uncharacterized protein n=1 Tax=Taeniopygia guttata TaxID=59729 RepID=A0A674H4N4_TAEGU
QAGSAPSTALCPGGSHCSSWRAVPQLCSSHCSSWRAAAQLCSSHCSSWRAVPQLCSSHCSSWRAVPQLCSSHCSSWRTKNSTKITLQMCKVYYIKFLLSSSLQEHLNGKQVCLF